MNSKITTLIVVAVVSLLGFGAVALRNNDDTMSMTNDTTMNQEQANSDNTQTSSQAQDTNNIVYKNFDVAPKPSQSKKALP